MNIHFFMDPFGYYSTQFTLGVEKINPENNLFVNINFAKITHEKIKYFTRADRNLKSWLKTVNNIERVYFHFYNPTFQELNRHFKKLNPDIISVWTFWGGDFYSLPEFTESKYLEFSKNATKKNGVSRKNIFRRAAVELFYRAKGGVPYNHKRFINSFHKIDYLAIYFKKDFDNVVNYSNANIECFKFSYLSLTMILGDLGNWTNYKLGDKIMIGHSGDPGLNHYEIIRQLDSFNCSKTLLLPIYYGNLTYKTKLIEAIKSFKLKLEVLDKYYSLQDYNVKLLEVGYAIFNVNHQQAFGNIVTLIWLGVKVFLHEESAIYKEFKDAGIFVLSISDIRSMNDFVPFSEVEKMSNKQVLQKILSQEVVEEMTKNLLELKKRDK
jgi:dTDP-N-acetylfucosamine:lipid II N-acetylfucosaminyltransferase